MTRPIDARARVCDARAALPSNIRARVCAASTSDTAWWRSRPRCGASRADGTRCDARVHAVGDVCWRHCASRDLPDELVVLRDPVTGEPMEVG
jgi:hypothetical protein